MKWFFTYALLFSTFLFSASKALAQPIPGQPYSGCVVLNTNNSVLGVGYIFQNPTGSEATLNDCGVPGVSGNAPMYNTPTNFGVTTYNCYSPALNTGTRNCTVISPSSGAKLCGVLISNAIFCPLDTYVPFLILSVVGLTGYNSKRKSFN
ncbi:hypothetical protein [Pedobacter sp. Leaf170]|uniref:hypothetical protein n=1 Tax=Pedobacter sp. Leaf170 TaxID=2876558 RepID=UPI001E457F73|nr:hypothetical protein [Pedobacter sp. Leaf170]